MNKTKTASRKNYIRKKIIYIYNASTSKGRQISAAGYRAFVTCTDSDVPLAWLLKRKRTSDSPWRQVRQTFTAGWVLSFSLIKRASAAASSWNQKRRKFLNKYLVNEITVSRSSSSRFTPQTLTVVFHLYTYPGFAKREKGTI